MKSLAEVSVRYYEYIFSDAEYIVFLIAKTKFNKDNYEGIHDPTDAVRVVQKDVSIVQLVANSDITAFVVKEHLANDWEEAFHG